MHSNLNNIFIVGNGAIGKTLAVFLNSKGLNVAIIRGSIDTGEKTTENITVELSNGEQRSCNIETVTFSTFSKLDGLILLTNKSFGNDTIAKKLKEKNTTAPLVILQNGLGVEKPFINEGFANIYRTVLFATSQIKEDGRVRFKPVSPSPIGIIKGNTDTLHRITELLNTIEFQFRPEPDIQTYIWRKAIMNIVFNSICPLLNTDNGIFHRNPKAMKLAQRIIHACVNIANISNIPVNSKEIEDGVLNISRSSDGQLISTLQDINNKRKTEIDTLNFELVRIAQSLNIERVANDISLLGELIKLKESINKNEQDL
ncbi:MAG TPA: 2-dehydropantoate 2-reductase [Cytophagaceae bacterium]